MTNSFDKTSCGIMLISAAKSNKGIIVSNTKTGGIWTWKKNKLNSCRSASKATRR